MNIRNAGIAGIVLLAAAAGSSAAAATDSSPWALRFGLHQVNPKSGNGTLGGGTLAVDVDSDIKPTLALDYYFSPNWSLDILAAVPFKHAVKLNGGNAVEITHLPPTVSLEYHFRPDATINPFLGVGVNYTFIYDEKARGALAGTDVSFDNSFGLAAQAGIEVALDDRWSLVADVRWMDIDTDVSVNGLDVGTANVDPLAVGVTAMLRF